MERHVEASGIQQKILEKILRHSTDPCRPWPTRQLRTWEQRSSRWWAEAETPGTPPILPPFSLLRGSNPCSAHSLNWVTNNAAKMSFFTTAFLNIIQALYNNFLASNKCWKILRIQINLKSLSMQWESWFGGIVALRIQFEVADNRVLELAHGIHKDLQLRM